MHLMESLTMKYYARMACKQSKTNDMLVWKYELLIINRFVIILDIQ